MVKSHFCSNLRTVTATFLSVQIFFVFLQYRNVPKFSDRQVWANSADPDQTAPLLIRVYTVCHSIHIFWTHYCTVKPLCLNFRVITANFSGVQIFRVSMVLFDSPSYRDKDYRLQTLVCSFGFCLSVTSNCCCMDLYLLSSSSETDGVSLSRASKKSCSVTMMLCSAVGSGIYDAVIMLYTCTYIVNRWAKTVFTIQWKECRINKIDNQSCLNGIQ